MTVSWTAEQILLGAAALLILSVIASKASGQLGVPALVLFLGIGMLAGSEGVGGIYFDNAWIAQAIGVVALAFILFSGGLDTRWQVVRPVLWPGLALSTVGVVLTAGVLALFATLALGMNPLEGMLLGAIVSSTDAAAVFAVLRSKGVHLKGPLEPLLELESGSNDPMAVLLTLGLTRLLIEPATPLLELAKLFVEQAVFGLVCGYVIARVAVTVINRIRLGYDGLYSVLTIAVVLVSYAATAVLGGSGFLATYVTGLVMGRYDFVHKRSLARFHDGLAWLMQILMFLTLGLQVYPSRLPQVAETGLVVAVFLIVFARPLSVLAALCFERLSLRDKIFVAWVGLRGAAPIVLATFPLVAGLSQSNMIFNLVFFIVLASALFQGMLIVPIARLLRVFDDNPLPIRSPLSFVMEDDQISDNLIECSVAAYSPLCGRQILDLNLPPNTLIIMIGRGGDLIVPRGDTIIQAGDRVLFLASPEVSLKVRAMLEQQSA